MDLDNAIKKHTEWKMKFRTAIKMKETMDAATIAKNNVCELGAWLAGEAKAKHGSLSGYQECAASHTAFHTEAGKIATAINANKFDEAEKMLGAGSAFALKSMSTASAIMKLKSQI